MNERSGKRVHVFVSGRVQGVFYRAECAREAGARGLGGFVRNLPDGWVEAVFEGSKEDVDAMVDWCRRGTSWSRVDAIDATEEPLRGEREFRIG